MTGLQFVVLDELHTYRGRQGADVAMLLRRLRERCGNPDLTCIGTSATMVAAESSRDPPRRGRPGGQHDLRGRARRRSGDRARRCTGRSCSPRAAAAAQLAEALAQELPETLSPVAFQQHPLAAWIEETFSLQVDPQANALIRARPLTLRDGATKLAALTGVDAARCEAAIRRFFQLGTRKRSGD